MKVVNLGRVRDLLGSWQQVADLIRRCRVQGFAITVMDERGKESVYIGGVYSQDRKAALRASMKMSTAITLEYEEPPRFRASR